ncbi:hypothetical protein Pmani_014314 [Petrolisthes manimaculis]|uniref:Uncharacterized protein n=1 Tax=Petrolisthes manimaculis TaxID=1843537 RepID=A0AAE1PT57_9EUCA|nr:hypothetical protein Pmani_014314 [Petrolisthes manimaculis]
MREPWPIKEIGTGKVQLGMAGVGGPRSPYLLLFFLLAPLLSTFLHTYFILPTCSLLRSPTNPQLAFPQTQTLLPIPIPQLAPLPFLLSPHPTPPTSLPSPTSTLLQLPPINPPPPSHSPGQPHPSPAAPFPSPLPPLHLLLLPSTTSSPPVPSTHPSHHHQTSPHLVPLDTIR